MSKLFAVAYRGFGITTEWNIDLTTVCESKSLAERYAESMFSDGWQVRVEKYVPEVKKMNIVIELTKTDLAELIRCDETYPENGVCIKLEKEKR